MGTAQKPATGQAVTRPQVSTVKQQRDALKEELAGYIPSYQQLLPPGYSAERLVTGALVAVTRDPALLRCTPLSVALSLAQVAQLGLDVGTTAHLVSFKSKVSRRGEPDRYEDRCTMIADYKGYIELMTNAGARKVEARVVRQGDEFEYRYGTEPFLKHIPKSETAAVTHAYAIIWITSNVTQFEVMTVAEVEEIRKKSKQWSDGPLPTWYARKTAIRRLVKYVPKRTSRLQALAEAEELEPGQVDENLLRRLEPGQQQPSGHVPVQSGGYDGPKADSDGVVQVSPEEEEELIRQQEQEILARERSL